MLNQLDFLFFAAGVVTAAAVTLIWIMRRRVLRRVSFLTGCAIIVWLFATWFFANNEESREKEKIKESLSALAPTYAGEIERLNHAAISNDTPPDDPTYLAIIEAQKRWIKANSHISSIYTYRVDPAGQVRLVVNCETDFDKNGVIEGDLEARVAIGEVFEEDVPSMKEAFLGKTTFDDIPTTDRWGTWVTSYCPLRDRDGKIEAVLGLDLDAGEWTSRLKKARKEVFMRSGIVVAAGLGLLIAAAAWIKSRESDAKHWESVVLRAEKTKFETLVDSVAGVVFEADAITHGFIYVSKQSAPVLSYTPEQCLSCPDFWLGKLHPEDLSAQAKFREIIETKQPYRLEYRMIAADGGVLWVREIASPVLDDEGHVKTVRGILHDITEQKNSAAELEKSNLALVKSSRLAGMAEVATGVLHNVGNVLNSVNVSASLVHEKIQHSQVFQLGKVAALLSARTDGIPEYLTRDPQGTKLPEYLEKLGQHLEVQNQEVLIEIDQLTRNIEHINKIVAMQQSYAKMSGVYEMLPLNQLIEDAISMNQAAFARHRITVTRQFDLLQPISLDRHKVLQILVNLIRNAKHAHDHSETQDKRIHIALTREGDFACVAVMDNGIGIPVENLDSIFRHGFTTRQEGHGFGLHGSANAANEMGGSLSVQSGGTNHGAAFILRLPLTPPAANSA